ncbi:MAG: metal-dependent hydrolase [Nitrospinaceae bacterium]|jgi:hypothetical protein|nr:metal-dependent hydrolase [Nitrospinaceae bacterium]MBT3821681.1 metal-dependent hydrolase [Nitrospinaceae bacterium]MBT4095180.1 metal-dependent hydrolase [Nitrospinaceae bacterium]MBT6395427.1 metal-dependent hydrolase [Nitrospinaceae bacterium]
MVGALALGGDATGAELVLCAVAGTSPDWDAALLVAGRPCYQNYHRSLTHGYAGLLISATIAGGFLFLLGWNFWHAAWLWLLAALGHTVSDLFNRSGVALTSPFGWERTRFPAVSWADGPLTLGVIVVAVWVSLVPEAGRLVSLVALAGYVAYIAWRRRDPKLSDPVSRWWFDMVHGRARNSVPGDASLLRKSSENQGVNG